MVHSDKPRQQHGIATSLPSTTPLLQHTHGGIMKHPGPCTLEHVTFTGLPNCHAGTKAPTQPASHEGWQLWLITLVSTSMQLSRHHNPESRRHDGTNSVGTSYRGPNSVLPAHRQAQAGPTSPEQSLKVLLSDAQRECDTSQPAHTQHRRCTGKSCSKLAAGGAEPLNLTPTNPLSKLGGAAIIRMSPLAQVQPSHALLFFSSEAFYCHMQHA